MQYLKNKQEGVTAIGFIFILAVIALFVIVLLKIMPVYIEYFSVSSSLESLVKEHDINKQSNKEIEALLQKRFTINNVTSVTQDHVKFIRDKNTTTVNVKYDVVKPLFGNIDLVLRFDESIELKGN